MTLTLRLKLKIAPNDLLTFETHPYTEVRVDHLSVSMAVTLKNSLIHVVVDRETFPSFPSSTPMFSNAGKALTDASVALPKSYF